MSETEIKYRWHIPAGLALFTAILSIPEIPLPPGPRQAELLYNGWAITQGLVPYRDFWDNGSPGAFFLYAIAVKIHHSYISVNILDILWRCATTMAIYLLSKRLWGKAEGIIAGVLFAMISSAIGAKFYLNAIPMSFTILPLVLGFYFYLDPKQRIGWNSLSGLFFGLASVLESLLLSLIIIIAFFAILTPRRTWEPRPRRAKMYSFLYGVIIVYTMLLFYFLLSWSIKDFVKQSFIFNMHNYSNQIAILILVFLFIFGIMVLSREVISLGKHLFKKGISASTRFITAMALVALILLAFLINALVMNSYFSIRVRSLPDRSNMTAVSYLRGKIDRKTYFSTFENPYLESPNYELNYEIASYLIANTHPFDIVNGPPFLCFLSRRINPWAITGSLADNELLYINEYNKNWENRIKHNQAIYGVRYGYYMRAWSKDSIAKRLKISDCSKCNCLMATQAVFNDNSYVVRICRFFR